MILEVILEVHIRLIYAFDVLKFQSHNLVAKTFLRQDRYVK